MPESDEWHDVDKYDKQQESAHSKRMNSSEENFETLIE
jgi:hypothetical protein